MVGVLEGIRILDFGRYIAGPFCGMLLADMGAEVIRIEKIGGSEDRYTIPVGKGADGEYSVGDKCRRCSPGTETSQDTSRCDSCLVQGAASYSTDGVEWQDCWENSEPFGPFNRAGCVCQPGFTANGTQVCVDIDECAVETSYSAAGV